MTQSKKHLDDLLGSVTNDTPTLERDELRSLLEQKTSGNLPMSPLQTTIITEDRRRGFYKKGIIIMTFITIATIAFLLTQQPSSTIVSSKPQAETKQSTISENLKKSPASTQSTEKYSAPTVMTPLTLPAPLIQPVEPLAASDAELTKLGIVRKVNGDVACYQDLHSNKVVYKMFFAAHIFGVNAGLRAKSHCELGDAIPAFSPEYVTNLNGWKVTASGPDSAHASVFDQLTPEEIERVDEIAAMQEKTPIPDLSSKLTKTDIELIQKLTKLADEIKEIPVSQPHHDANELVPVLVRKNSIVNGKAQNDGLIFWYAPNPELQNIIHGTAGIQPSLSNGEGLIKNVSLYPNPATSTTKLHFTLSEQRLVHIALFEITGKKIKDLEQGISLEIGEHDSDIPTSLLTNGIYLVVITTDRGEQNIQRLVINK